MAQLFRCGSGNSGKKEIILKANAIFSNNYSSSTGWTVRDERLKTAQKLRLMVEGTGATDIDLENVSEEKFTLKGNHSGTVYRDVTYNRTYGTLIFGNGYYGTNTNSAWCTIGDISIEYWAEKSVSSNTNLRYNEEEGYVEIIDDAGNWHKIYKADDLPVLEYKQVFENGVTEYTGKNLNSGSFSIATGMIVGTGKQGRQAYVYQVDLTEYSRIEFDCVTDHATSTSTWLPYVGWTNSAYDFNKYTVITTTASTISIDISTVSGLKYVGLSIWGSSNNGYTASVSAIRLYK